MKIFEEGYDKDYINEERKNIPKLPKEFLKLQRSDYFKNNLNKVSGRGLSGGTGIVLLTMRGAIKFNMFKRSEGGNLDYVYEDRKSIPLLKTKNNTDEQLPKVTVGGNKKLIAFSKQPKAKDFRKWIVDSIKEIRQKGFYIDPSYNEEKLQRELLEEIYSLGPNMFEELCLDVMLKTYGYGMYNKVKSGQPGDKGIDGFVFGDDWGVLDKFYLQAKNWKSNPVGSKEVQSFKGAMNDAGAQKGLLITSGRFTSNASESSKKGNIKIILVDGDQLTKKMIDKGIGVIESKVKSKDEKYFKQMRLKFNAPKILN